MIQKIIAFIELWMGFTFFIILLGYIPVVGASIGGVLSGIISVIAGIPYYSIIIALFGTVLFFDGAFKLFMR